MKKTGLSYVELNPYGCTAIHLENLRTKEHDGASAPNLSEKDSKALAETVIKLFEMVSVKKKSLYRGYKEYEKMEYTMTMMYRGSLSDLNYIVPTKFVLAFVAMYDIIAKSTQNTYSRGMDRGKNLLIGLTDGTYTINDFNVKSKTEEED